MLGKDGWFLVEFEARPLELSLRERLINSLHGISSKMLPLSCMGAGVAIVVLPLRRFNRSGCQFGEP